MVYPMVFFLCLLIIWFLEVCELDHSKKTLLLPPIVLWTYYLNEHSRLLWHYSLNWTANSKVNVWALRTQICFLWPSSWKMNGSSIVRVTSSKKLDSLIALLHSFNCKKITPTFKVTFYLNSSRDQSIDFFVGWRGIRQKENQETCRGEMIIFLIRIIIRKPNSIIIHF